MIEGALVLPILLLLLFGIMEISRALMTYNVLTRAVRAGARLAVVTPKLTEDDGRVVGRIADLLKDGGITGDIDVAINGGESGESLRGARVRVSAQVDFIPAVLMVFGSDAAIPLQAQVVARHE